MDRETIIKYGQIILFVFWAFLAFYVIFQDISLGVDYYQP